MRADQIKRLEALGRLIKDREEASKVIVITVETAMPKEGGGLMERDEPYVAVMSPGPGGSWIERRPDETEAAMLERASQELKQKGPVLLLQPLTLADLRYMQNPSALLCDDTTGWAAPAWVGKLITRAENGAI